VFESLPNSLICNSEAQNCAGLLPSTDAVGLKCVGEHLDRPGGHGGQTACCKKIQKTECKTQFCVFSGVFW
jgi:hypothetical protein